MANLSFIRLSSKFDTSRFCNKPVPLLTLSSLVF